MAASNRLDPRTVIVCRGLLAYAWVPSQEDLHRLWRTEELQAGPKQKKKGVACGAACLETCRLPIG